MPMFETMGGGGESRYFEIWEGRGPPGPPGSSAYALCIRCTSGFRLNFCHEYNVHSMEYDSNNNYSSNTYCTHLVCACMCDPD